MEHTGELLKTLEREYDMNVEGLTQLLLCDSSPLIFRAAERVREIYVGNEVHLRGLLEFSNYCCRTCFYCGLRAPNKSVERYRMDCSEIVKAAEYAVHLGLKTIVLQAGEDRTYSITELCGIVEGIKRMDVAVTLSIGELSRKEYMDLRKAGADRYLLRIETSDKQLYQKLHPGMSFKNRERCLWDLKELGYEVGTGCLVGLPGQDAGMLAKDLKFFKHLDADMIGVGPFIPCAGTPVEHEEGGKVETVLRMVALTRLLLPDINIPATTALGVKDVYGYKKGLRCGANVIMPNVGNIKYRKLYKIYPGKDDREESIESQIKKIKDLVHEEGRFVSKGKGFRGCFCEK